MNAFVRSRTFYPHACLRLFTTYISDSFHAIVPNTTGMSSIIMVQHRTVILQSCPRNLHTTRHHTPARRHHDLRISLACTSAPNSYVDAGPKTPEPDYTQLDSQPLNRLVMALFRMKMVSAIGQDSRFEGWVSVFCVMWVVGGGGGTEGLFGKVNVGVSFRLTPTAIRGRLVHQQINCHHKSTLYWSLCFYDQQT